MIISLCNKLFNIMINQQNNNFVVIKDLLLHQLTDFGLWNTIRFPENHEGRGPIQPPTQWTNVTLIIPYGAVGVQLTGDPRNENNHGAYYAAIEDIDIEYQKIHVSVEWWREGWVLYVGWKMENNFIF